MSWQRSAPGHAGATLPQLQHCVTDAATVAQRRTDGETQGCEHSKDTPGGKDAQYSHGPHSQHADDRGRVIFESAPLSKATLACGCGLEKWPNGDPKHQWGDRYAHQCPPQQDVTHQGADGSAAERTQAQYEQTTAGDCQSAA
jgi:hypothetical protein